MVEESSSMEQPTPNNMLELEEQQEGHVENHHNSNANDNTNMAEEGEEEEVEENENTNTGSHNYCTFAATGAVPVFQAIFICHECFNQNDKNNSQQPLCICQACADYCHDSNDHDVEYIGMGPCYCDCDHVGNCTIYQKSLLEAERLGVVHQNNNNNCCSSHYRNNGIAISPLHAAATAPTSPVPLFSTTNANTSPTIPTTITTTTTSSPATAALAALAAGSSDDADDNNTISTSTTPKKKYLQDVYDIPTLLLQEEDSDALVAQLLVQHAQELILHTKDTHWLDVNTIMSKGGESSSSSSLSSSLCPLEQLAWYIYQRHVHHYFPHNNNNNGGGAGGGAEWWVQVKEIWDEGDHPHHQDASTLLLSSSSSSSSPSHSVAAGETTPPNERNKRRRKGHSAIDLHYDKDEALAESFGIGSFPTLSTVTYLTAHPDTAPPTIVFDHTYSQGEDEVMDQMLLSRPRVGKHLVFDGSLLHGAPVHPLLQPYAAFTTTTTPTTTTPTGGGGDESLTSPVAKSNHNNNNDDDDVVMHSHTKHNSHDDQKQQNNKKQPQIRVTFLVNIWTNRQKPANVQPLSDAIRKKLWEAFPKPIPFFGESTTTNTSCYSHHHNPFSMTTGNPLIMVEQPISHVVLQKEEDLPEALRQRIELPFVTKGITWDDDEDVLLKVAKNKKKETSSKTQTHSSPTATPLEDSCSSSSSTDDHHNNNDDDDDDDGRADAEEGGEEGGGLVVVTFPPPPTAEDTVLVSFGPSLQAYLDYPFNNARLVQSNKNNYTPPTTREEFEASPDYQSGYV